MRSTAESCSCSWRNLASASSAPPAAWDYADLQRVIDQVVDDTHVTRASTVISLATRLDHRMVPLVGHLLEQQQHHQQQTHPDR